MRKSISALARVVWDSGVLCMVVAAITFSASGLFVKLLSAISPPRISVFEVVFFRSGTSLLVCAAAARSARIAPMFGHRKSVPLLLARGLFGAAAMTTYYYSIQMLPLADAVTLFFLNPAVTALAAWAVLRERMGLHGLAGVACCVAGLLLLTHPPFLFGGHAEWGTRRIVGAGLGLASAFLAAGAFCSIRLLGKSEPAIVMSIYFHSCAATSSAVPLAAGVPLPAALPTGVQFALLLGIAGTSFWGQMLIGRGFQLLAAVKAATINLSQVVYSYLLGLIFLGDALTLFGVSGSLLICAGALLANVKPKAKPVPPQLPDPQQDGGSREADKAGGAGGRPQQQPASLEPTWSSRGGSITYVDLDGHKTVIQQQHSLLRNQNSLRIGSSSAGRAAAGAAGGGDEEEGSAGALAGARVGPAAAAWAAAQPGPRGAGSGAGEEERQQLLLTRSDSSMRRRELTDNIWASGWSGFSARWRLG